MGQSDGATRRTAPTARRIGRRVARRGTRCAQREDRSGKGEDVTRNRLPEDLGIDPVDRPIKSAYASAFRRSAGEVCPGCEGRQSATRRRSGPLATRNPLNLLMLRLRNAYKHHYVKSCCTAAFQTPGPRGPHRRGSGKRVSARRKCEVFTPISEQERKARSCIAFRNARNRPKSGRGDV